MRITSRLLILFIVIAIVFGAFFYMFYHIKHEEMRVYQEADLNQRKITIDTIFQLKNDTQLKLTEDYALWDETVDYIRDRDPSWEKSKLNTIIPNFDYSLVQVYDAAGKVIFSEAKSSIPGLALFELEPAMIDSLRQKKKLSFFTRYYHHLLSLTISSIHPSDDTEHSSQIQGYFLIAQSWDYSYLSNFAKALNYDIRISEEEPVAEEGAERYNTKIVRALYDYKRQPVAWMVFYSSNPFLIQLRNLGNIILFGTMGFVFIFLLMQFFLIQQWISAPLNMISQSLQQNDPTLIRKLDKANNEFSEVAKLIQLFFAQKEELLNEIDERKKTEIRLREMEEQSRKILLTSPESIIVTELDGTIIEVNTETLRLLEISDRDAFLKSKAKIDSLLRKKDRTLMAKILAELKKGSYVKNREIYLENDQGHGFPGLLSASVIYDDSNVPFRFIFVTRDMTDIRNLEQQLRQSQKMESIGTLAGGIAHDFNNIITIIAGYIALATGKIQQPKDAEHDLDAALKACLRAKSLIGKILTFSRQSEPDMEDLVLAQIVEETLPMIRALLPTKIEIQTEINNQSYTTADSTELQQVLINLATNAYHAMRPDGGTLSIRLDEISGQELSKIDNKAIPQLRYIHLAVSDTGSGIAPEIINRIFDPYFSTKSSGEGTGLGLSIVHGIVTGYNGFINVRSVLSEGTCFNIYLPINEHPKKKSKKEISMDLPFIPAKIIVIDDEPDLVDIFCEALRDAGYDVEAYTDSLLALSVFIKAPTSYDLIIADINMPQMDGINLASKIREIRKIPILLYTGFLDLNMQNRAEKVGVKNVLNKPIMPDAMIQEVRQMLYEESIGPNSKP